jgi:hypothetical protein
MKFLDKIANTLAFILQVIIVGLVLAWLRHNQRWIYYPIKWFATMIMCLMLGAFGLVVFKLGSEILGISTSEWFSQLMYDIGTSTDLKKAGFIFGASLLIMGSFVGAFIDTVIYYIELTIFSGQITRYDPQKKDVVITNSEAWNPTLSQSLMWNLYGFTVFITIWYRILTL